MKIIIKLHGLKNDNTLAIDDNLIIISWNAFSLPSTPEKGKEEYKSVDTLLFFVGYSRSRHTLLASLLDGHPHMVVANEKNLFYRLRQGGEFKRNEMFDMLVQGSKGFLKGGKGMVMSGNLQNTTHFGFWMEGYWQGCYDQYIQVSMNVHTPTVEKYVLSLSLRSYGAIWAQFGPKQSIQGTIYFSPLWDSFQRVHPHQIAKFR